MAKIVVDLEKLRVLETGLGQFALELSRALVANRNQDDEFIYFVPPGREYFYEGEPVTIKLVRRWSKDQNIRKLRRFSKIVRGPKHDIWHVTNQTSRYLPWNPHTPVLLTIHDLNFLREKPQHTHARQLEELQRKIDRSARVTVISNFVAAEVRQWLELGGRGLDVVYNGVATAERFELTAPAEVPNKPFLFSIGCFTDKKNFHTLVEMLPQLPEMDLVIAGINDLNYGSYVRRCAVKCGVTDRLWLPGPISENDRAWYYRNCRAFAFPSLTEGFGLPPIEAMTAGKPVFLSNLTSLPEVGGDVAYYWERFDPLYMAQVVREGLEAADRDPRFAERIQRHSKQFCWGRAARHYLQIYREMIEERRFIRSGRVWSRNRAA